MTKDLTGLRFEMLTALHPVIGHRRRSWKCRCDCGNTRDVQTGHLTEGHTRSCGCRDLAKTHGHSFVDGKVSPTYSSWKSMVARCSYPSNPAFAHYKKMGVKICDGWLKFENFLADMGERPGMAYSIDRHPNNLGNYEPGNCRWATKREQANNRTTNVTFEYQGETFTLIELSRRTGVSKDRLRQRLIRAPQQWTIDEAISRPNSRGRRTDRGF